ncbi:MAG TPA: ATP-binding protein [Planctomycetota bacterium]|nr:ATP-binding protein [Planctomycetota bacterium]
MLGLVLGYCPLLMDGISRFRAAGGSRVEIYSGKPDLLRRLRDRKLPTPDVLFLPSVKKHVVTADFIGRIRSISPGLFIIETNMERASAASGADATLRLPEEAERLQAVLAEACAAGEPLAAAVTERRELERMLASAQIKMQSVLDQLSEGVAVVEPGCTITRVNRKLVELLHPGNGSAEDASGFLGRPCHEALWGLPNRCANCPKTTGTRLMQESRTMEAGGKAMQLDVTASLMADSAGNAVGVLETVRDASPRLRLEARLIESEKMKAIGLIAAGMAHELRNPLAVISTTAECGQQMTDDADVAESFETIMNAVQSADKVIRELLNFARPAPDYFQPVAIGELLATTMSMVAARARKQGVQMEIDAPDSLPMVHADRGKLQQALLNFMLNSIDAMQEGGSLSLAACARGGGLEITIADTGCGMSKEEQARLFEPFFSTKRGGVGLGMSVSKKIIDSHQGRVEIDSAAGRGTVLKVLLPARVAPERRAVEIA